MPFSTLLLAVWISSESPDIPFMQPQLATDGRTIGVTFGSRDGVFFARSGDEGKTFSKPVLVSRSGKLMLGRHRGPRVSMTPGAIVISAIVHQKVADKKSVDSNGHKHQDHKAHHSASQEVDGDLVSWRSTDGGETWSSGTKVNDVVGSAREGLHAMGSGGGVLFATWLDLRDKGTRLYGSVSRDEGKSWSKNILVYESPSGTICQCCHPSVSVDSTGQIAVMLRNALNGSRDMYLVRSTDGAETFSKATKLGEGTWVLNACPMDGGGVAVTAKGNVVSVWRREKEIFTASSSGPEKRIAIGKDPTVAISGSGTYIAWTSALAVHALVPGKSEPIVLSAEGAYPQLIPIQKGKVLAAWESKGALSLELLP